VTYNDDNEEEELFGPMAKQALQKKAEQVQISVYDLTNDEPDFKKKEVFGVNELGSLRRDKIAEDIEKNIELNEYEHKLSQEQTSKYGMVDEESRFKKRVEEIKTKQAKMDEVNHEKMI